MKHFLFSLEDTDNLSLIEKFKKLFGVYEETVGQKGDLSLLQNIMNHAKQKRCEICQKHSPSTNSLKILQEISISSGSQKDAPKIVQIDLVGEPFYDELSSGEYTLQDRLINERPFWRHMNLRYVIWFNNVDCRWMISHSKDIGTSQWLFAGPIGSNKWPNEISFIR